MRVRGAVDGRCSLTALPMTAEIHVHDAVAMREPRKADTAPVFDVCDECTEPRYSSARDQIA